MSEETKHTPGPFHVEFNDVGGQGGCCGSYDIVNDDRMEIAKIETCNYDDEALGDEHGNGWRTSKKAEEDALFVALAMNTHDDMLAALKAVQKSMKRENLGSCGFVPNEYLRETIDSAIAKAEGRAE